MSHRPTIYGMRHSVSAGHYLAAAAGFSVLEAGGNAIDAGCAAGIALGVLQPDLVNAAGVAPIMIRMADGQVESIAGLGIGRCGCRPTCSCASTAAGSPRASCAPWCRRRPMPGSPPCSDMARCGSATSRRRRFASPKKAFPSIRCWRRRSRRMRTSIAATPRTKRSFCRRDACRGGREIRPVRSGADAAIHGRPGPRRTGSHDRPGAAHHAFYRGDIARAIVTFQKAEGGYLDHDDLANFRSRIEPVVRRRWRGHEVIVCGPWCQGPALLQALALVEHLGIDGLAHNSADLPAPDRRVPEPCHGGPGVFLRRPGLRRCADRPSA